MYTPDTYARFTAESSSKVTIHYLDRKFTTNFQILWPEFYKLTCVYVETHGKRTRKGKKGNFLCAELIFYV